MVHRFSAFSLWLIFMGHTTSHAETQPAEPYPDANLYIFREHAEPTAWAPTVKIDGKKIVALGNKSYTAIHLAPGQYKITLNWPLMATQRSAGANVEIKEGSKTYLEVTGTSRYNGYYMWLGSGIGQAKPELAQATIATCCKFKAPK